MPRSGVAKDRPGKLRTSLASALAALAILAPPGMAQQGITFGGFNGEAGFSSEGRWSAVGPQQAGRLSSYWEWVELGLSADAIGGRLARLDASVRPEWRQVDGGGILSRLEQRVSFVGWNADLRVLPGRRLSGIVTTRRFQTRRGSSFGRDEQSVSTAVTGSATWNFRPLPFSISYSTSSSDASRLADGQPIDLTLDRSLSRLVAVAQNTRTRIAFERRVSADRLGSLNFSQRSLDLGHRLRWGKGSSISTSMNLFGENGDVVSASRFSWQETATLQHLRVLSSTWQGGYNRQTTNQTVSSAFVSLAVRARPAGFLTTAVSGSRRWFRVAASRRVSTGLGSSAGYGFGVGALRLQGSVAVSYRVTGGSPVTAGRLSVFDERHVLDAAGSAALNEINVVDGTVRVRSVDGSAVFREGIDYELIVTDPLLSVFALPGGALGAGDSVLVDYLYDLVSDAARRNLSASVSHTAVFGAFQAYQRYINRTTPGETPSTSDLTGRDDLDEFGLGLSGATALGPLRVDAAVEYSSLSGPGTSFASTSFRTGMSFSPYRHVSVRINGSLIRARGGDLLSAARGDIAVEWTPRPRVSARGRLGLWDTERLTARQRFLGGGAEVIWQPGRLRMTLGYSHTAIRNGIARVEHRLSFYVARTF